HVPSSLGEGGTNNAIFGRMRLDSPSEPIGDNDVTGRPWLRYAQDVGAWSPCRLINGDDLTKALRVPIPEPCKGIGRCGIAKIPVTSIKARCRLKNNPRCKLGAIPRSLPVGVVLRHQHPENVLFTQVLLCGVKDLFAGNNRCHISCCCHCLSTS